MKMRRWLKDLGAAAGRSAANRIKKGAGLDGYEIEKTSASTSPT
jgi:hypothetical protein